MLKPPTRSQLSRTRSGKVYGVQERVTPAAVGSSRSVSGCEEPTDEVAREAQMVEAPVVETPLEDAPMSLEEAERILESDVNYRDVANAMSISPYSMSHFLFVEYPTTLAQRAMEKETAAHT